MKIPENVKFRSDNGNGALYFIGKAYENDVKVSWRAGKEHSSDGSHFYDVDKVLGYLQTGEWVVVEDKHKELTLTDKIKAFVKETDSEVIFCRHKNWEVFAIDGSVYHAETDENLIKVMEAVTLLHAVGAIKG